MALPRSKPLGQILDDAQARWSKDADEAASMSARMASQDVSAGTVLSVLGFAWRELDYFEAVAATPGIGQYAVDQLGEYSLASDVATDFNALLAALGALESVIIGLVPQAGGKLAVRAIDEVGRQLVTDVYTPAQTAPVRTALNDVVSTVA